ncbi:MAG: RNA polymerase sigma factor [Acidimicrobiales bacterium]
MTEVIPDAAQTVGAMLDAHGRCVHHYLLKRCGDPGLADELTAETFACAFVALQRASVPRSGLPWLLGIATHKLADHWRRESREQRMYRAVVDQYRDVDRTPDSGVDTSRAAQALDELDPHHRIALVLRYHEELSVPEIATVLHRSVHGTESLLARARRSFKKSYADAK